MLIKRDKKNNHKRFFKKENEKMTMKSTANAFFRIFYLESTKKKER